MRILQKSVHMLPVYELSSSPSQKLLERGASKSAAIQYWPAKLSYSKLNSRAFCHINTVQVFDAQIKSTRPHEDPHCPILIVFCCMNL